MSTTLRLNQKVAFSKLLWVGPLAIIVSVLANLILRALAVTALNPSPEFQPLATSGPVIFLTAVGALGAVIAYALVGRFAKQPIRAYHVIAAAALVVSLVPDLMLFSGNAPFGGVTVSAVLVLMAMHVVTWAISVGLLTTLGVER